MDSVADFGREFVDMQHAQALTATQNALERARLDEQGAANRQIRANQGRRFFEQDEMAREDTRTRERQQSAREQQQLARLRRANRVREELERNQMREEDVRPPTDTGGETEEEGERMSEAEYLRRYPPPPPPPPPSRNYGSFNVESGGAGGGVYNLKDYF